MIISSICRRIIDIWNAGQCVPQSCVDEEVLSLMMFFFFWGNGSCNSVRLPLHGRLSRDTSLRTSFRMASCIGHRWEAYTWPETYQSIWLGHSVPVREAEYASFCSASCVISFRHQDRPEWQDSEGSYAVDKLSSEFRLHVSHSRSDRLNRTKVAWAISTSCSKHSRRICHRNSQKLPHSPKWIV